MSTPDDASERVHQPNAARLYDYWLGGKDNYVADRRLACEIKRLAPWLPGEARANRSFVRRAVGFLTRSGVDQLLDIGCGLPAAPNVHDAARQINPAARVLYVDADPVVLSHARALLATDTRTAVARGDVRQLSELLAEEVVTAHLDLSRPVGVLLCAVLHTIADDEAAGALEILHRVLAPGSHTVISHATPGKERHRAATAAAARLWTMQLGPCTLREPEQIRAWLRGWDLVRPGIVPAGSWGADVAPGSGRRPVAVLGCVARRP